MKTKRTSPQPPPRRPTAPASASRREPAEATNVWGPLEQKRFLKVPKVVFRLGRFNPKLGKEIQPRHILLLLTFASRQFQKKPIQAYWEELAKDLGIKRDTVRKWGYELKAAGWLRITPNRGRDPKTNKPGIRNERNTFHIGPFIEIAAKADARWKSPRTKKQESGT